MKVCIIDSSDFMNFPAGGQVSFLHDFVEETAKADVDIYLAGIIKIEKEGRDTWSSLVIGNKEFKFYPLFTMPPQSKKRNLPFRFQIFFRTLRMRAKLLQRRYGILYIHSPEMLFPFIYPKKAKIIVHTHGLWENTLRFSKHKWLRNRAFVAVFKKCVKFAFQKADAVIVVNRESLEFYKSLLPLQKEKIIWIPTGVNVKLFRPMKKRNVRELYGFHAEDEIVIFSGRLSWNKGLDLLLEAFRLLSAELGRAKLVFVGDGEQRRYLAEQAIAMQIRDKTVFLGERPRSELPLILNCADVLALTSFVEGMPMAVLESLACGVPVVAMNVGDVSNVVIDGMTGYTIAERDPLAFKNRLLKSLGNRDRMMENCVKISQEYAISSIAQKIIKVLRTY
jgi:glycosyltransferase involved in cell wall biosynthesis